MADYVISLNLFANGNIIPSSFVKGDSSNDLYALQAGVGDTPIGISGTFTKGLPGSDSASSYEATGTGDNLLVYPAGAVCLLTCGTAWSAYQFLMPDSAGKGQPWVPGFAAGALALQAATASQQVRVLVLPAGLEPSSPAGLGNLTAVKTSAYAIQATDEVVLADPTGGGFTVTLPTAVGAKGKTYILKNVSASTNTITMGSTSSQTINAAAASSTTITTAGGALRFFSDGANWFTW